MHQPPPKQPLFVIPDFRNLGVMLRLLLGVNALMLLCALFQPGDDALLSNLFSLASWVEPALLITLGLLMLLSVRLARQRHGVMLVVLISITGILLQHRLFYPHTLLPPGRPLLAGLLALLTLHYFSLRQRALSPALSEARLAALQARIRPHFLFNSLNAAIALIRTRPEQAEMVLENLADLFRAQMADPARASCLEREIALAKMYLAIENERLGQQLNVVWDIQAALDASMPPLILQPLVENAVLHGLKGHGRHGEIRIRAQIKNGQLLLSVSNPAPDRRDQPHRGNQMAMDNLRERLQLFYDAEASLQVAEADQQYHTLIRLPYRPLRPEQQFPFAH